MEIELFDGRVKAIIDPQGAWITNLSDEYGDVLFPKRTLEEADGSKKVRGGCHICLPNFGPGGTTNLPQHGFARTALWEVVSSTATTAELYLSKGLDMYKTLHAGLAFEIDGNALLMTLSVTNNGLDTLRVAPGFHPYFMTARGEDSVVIDDESVQVEELGEVQFVTDNSSHILLANKTRYMLDADGLSTWAKWTDNLGSYVCIEPTVAGFSFLKSDPSVKELLMPSETRKYSLRIAWDRSR